MRITQKLKMVLSEIQANCATKTCLSCKLFVHEDWQCILFSKPSNWKIETLETLEDEK